MSAVAVRETCRAKLNLFLDVVGRRPDGYHDLVTVFHEIDLADDLDVACAPDPGVTIVVDPPAPDVPSDASNLAVRAAAALLARAPGRGVSLRLRKRIPAGGGLGGGSADAAGALRAVDRVLGLGLSRHELREVAAALGSDVPFLVDGGSALAAGRGEVMTAVPSRPIDFLLLVPSFPLSTAAVYGALPRDLPSARDPGPVVQALARGDADALGRACENALFEGARRVDARVNEVMSGARAALGRRVHLTGSGSTFFVPLRADEPTPDVRAIPHLRDVLRTRSATR